MPPTKDGSHPVFDGYASIYIQPGPYDHSPPSDWLISISSLVQRMTTTSLCYNITELCSNLPPTDQRTM
ncbi:hypothetical protein MTO96_027263 [Rhipicephalus appendiculatus]